jgi:LysM repeat protein
MRTGLLTLGFCFLCNLIVAQSSGRMTRGEYFDTYKDIAVHEMQRSGVPASITLAQGALESGDGNSRLAKKGNNHFGIKCHNSWKGKKIYQDDDSRHECFRQYGSVEDSYHDHSDYLRETRRYAFLFELDPTDYKGWAKGLKRAGYATSSSYASKLIEIIEEFNLHKYDTMAGVEKPSHKKSKDVSVLTTTRPVFERNRVKYIVAIEGDTYESLTLELNKLKWEFPKYNDTNINDYLSPGQVVYIQPKRNKAEAGKSFHIVKQGETMLAISQLYAVKLDRLYDMNLLEPGTEPEPGTSLQLRKQLKSPVANSPTKKHVIEYDEEEIKVDLNLN